MKLSVFAALGLAISLIAAPVLADSTKVTVEQVHNERTQLKDKIVEVHGKVVKVNNGIMRRNFVHIEDGTGSGDTARVIITSQQTAEVGDTITAKGTVVLDTDFGMGYFYATLIEKAEITK